MIKEAEFNSVVMYIKKKLLEQWEKYDVITATDMIRLPELAPYEQYLVTIVNAKKKAPKKPVITSEYKEAWESFWKLFPSTKSVPGTSFKSGAVMKKNETKMFEKWLSAITSGKITIEKMYYAANCYLQWAYEDSKRLGRNELFHRNGLEPWLNGQVYLTYMDMEIPVIQEEKKQTITTLDI